MSVDMSFVEAIVAERNAMIEHAQNNARILIIRHMGLGDVLMLVPVIQRIRQTYPDAQIDLMTSEPFFMFFRHLVDNLYDYNDPNNKPTGSYTHIYNLVMGVELHPKTYDIPRQDLFFDLCGFDNAGFDIVPRLDLSAIYTIPQVNDMNMKYGRMFGRKLIVLALDTSRASKNWSRRNWIKLIKRLVKAKPNYHVVLVGVNELKIKFNNNRIFNLTGKTNMWDLTYILSRTDLIVTGETGIMHLAGFMGKQQLVLVGPTKMELFASYYENLSYISIPLPCSGCCSMCGWGICMHMSVENVFYAIDNIMQTRKAAIYADNLANKRLKLQVSRWIDTIYRKLGIFRKRALKWRAQQQTKMEGTGLRVVKN